LNRIGRDSRHFRVGNIIYHKWELEFPVKLKEDIMEKLSREDLKKIIQGGCQNCADCKLLAYADDCNIPLAEYALSLLDQIEPEPVSFTKAANSGRSIKPAAPNEYFTPMPYDDWLTFFKSEKIERLIELINGQWIVEN
jgi:hypothetical protein